METIDINIKILNDKYEIFLNKIICKSTDKNIITYIGKNIYENKKILIDVYHNNIQIFAKKIINNIIYINHNNIIKIIDIIIEKNITYIIKPYFDKFINKYISENNTDIISYFNQILSAITYLYSKDIEFENITLEQLYIIDKQLFISPYFENNRYPENIIYGSPIYNLYNIKNKNNIENKIIINIRQLFLDIIYKKINKINKINIDINKCEEIEEYEIIMYLNNDNKMCLTNITNYFKTYCINKLNNINKSNNINKLNKIKTESTNTINSIFDCEL